MLHVIDAVPVAASVKLYDVPTVEVVMLSSVVVMIGAVLVPSLAATVIVLDSVNVRPLFVFVAVNVIAEADAVTVGVPLITPLVANVKPDGKEPLVIDQTK